MSDNAKLYSPNLSAPATALKQKGWGGRKVNWFVILTRGVVHVEVMPADWTLDGPGLAAFVERLPGALRTMLGPSARLPRMVFTDRGTGMYNSTGKIVRAYAQAVQKNGFRVYWGEDASQQSPDMGDLLLHETAVAWLRKGMAKEKPDVLPWEETTQQWTQRVRRVVRKINEDFDVRSLCRQFRARLEATVATQGERLRK